ncbi:MAG: ABC transporter ATP-binding protein [Thermoanaerobaculia bacterium]
MTAGATSTNSTTSTTSTSATSHPARVTLERIRAGYGRERDVLVALDLTIPSGVIAVLLGENGAGKSTLLKVLAGILEPRGGRALFDGVPLRDVSRSTRALRIGYLAQGFEPFFPATAMEIVLLGRTPRLTRFGTFEESDRRAAAAALEELDAAGLRDVDIRQMSGGERQRVLLARVLAGEADLLLLDEPTANLDPRHRLLLIQALRRRVRAGATVVLSTHELDVATAAADEAVLLKGGGVLASGPIHRTFTGPLLSELFGVPASVTTAEGGRPAVWLGYPPEL